MIVEQMLKNAPNPLLHIADVSGSALFQGDCLDIMPLMPDKSVQLILADLPYGTTACKWDSIIDLDLLWKQYKRIIKDNGAIVLTASQPFTTKLISSNYEMFKYEWIWGKNLPTGFATAKYQPMKSHESILVFGYGKLRYNPQPTETRIKDRKLGGSNGIRSKAKSGSVYGDLQTKESEIILKNIVSPRSLIEIPCVPRATGTFHPTQKPVELMEYLIKTYTNENDMVLDNTMGSGTTCLAAKELNRKFIGIEKEANYYEIACRRCGF
jgi:site-specific DNA-methyltransferase (adenine-specific)